MEFRTFIMILLSSSVLAEINSQINSQGNDIKVEEPPPEGYYAFIESPNAEPPKVRPPPYPESDKECYDTGKQEKGVASIHNICGDLNKGYIPRNPMKQKVSGLEYPFELIKNHTLKFLSKTLPILKTDDSLPKVTKVQSYSQNTVNIDGKRSRSKRSAPTSDVNTDANRNGRKYCESGGIWCMLYKAIQGEPLSPAAERRDEPAPPEYRQKAPADKPEYTGPPTPCPAKVEYATPVFAKNYQGIWRYVVQIPYEGYFTQTIELTRCMQTRCHYLDGGCLSSPRWTSLLVAEIFYPDTFNEDDKNSKLPVQRDPVAGSPPPVHDYQNFQMYLEKRAGENEGRSTPTRHHCDGIDEMGCFQVRIYHEWFLVPGSCKCWRPDYFNRFARRTSTAEL